MAEKKVTASGVSIFSIGLLEVFEPLRFNVDHCKTREVVNERGCIC